VDLDQQKLALKETGFGGKKFSSSVERCSWRRKCRGEVLQTRAQTSFGDAQKPKTKEITFSWYIIILETTKYLMKS
jgi:hypothetical protein